MYNLEIIKIRDDFRRFFLIFVAICFVAVICISYSLQNSENIKNYIEDEQLIGVKHEIRHFPKQILLWNKMFSYANWGWNFDPEIGATPEYFKQRGCSVYNCFVTLNHTHLNSITQFDAIIFHAAQSFKPPSERSRHQLYVFGTLEAPTYFDTLKTVLAPNLHMKNFYNLTMTYRLDADVFWPYYTMETSDGSIVAPLAGDKKPNWLDESQTLHERYFDEHLLEKVKNKTKLAAWFVSNCNDKSHRMDLVRQIQHSIPVHVYGKCGTYRCPRNNESACFEMLDTDYKFYFSFENSLCIDYVTEKLFLYMSYDIVPVVYGGGDYSQYAPPHSYINVNDFETTDDLAKYLIFLNDNPEEYIKYFWWKKHYRLSKLRPFVMCDLCEKLNDPYYTRTEHVYRDVNKSPWSSNTSCNIKPKIRF